MMPLDVDDRGNVMCSAQKISSYLRHRRVNEAIFWELATGGIPTDLDLESVTLYVDALSET